MKVVKKDFWIPCSFENRKPYLLDSLLYIPPHYDQHEDFTLPSWDQVFGNDFPVVVEYCSGNGTWIFEKAQKNPNLNWIAVEKDLSRARLIWLKLKNHNVDNLFVVFGDAKEFTQHYLKEDSIDQMYINFPDPWPKRRHHKNRLIQEGFVTNLAKILKKKKTIIIATDDFGYSAQVIQFFCRSTYWSSCFEKPYYKNTWSEYGSSFFQDLWQKKGKETYFHQFMRKQYV